MNNTSLQIQEVKHHQDKPKKIHTKIHHSQLSENKRQIKDLQSSQRETTTCLYLQRGKEIESHEISHQKLTWP